MRDGLDAIEIGKYLRENPDFFVDNEEVLETLRIPHQDKGTISLIEKQLEISKLKQRELKNKFLASLKTLMRMPLYSRKHRAF